MAGKLCWMDPSRQKSAVLRPSRFLRFLKMGLKTARARVQTDLFYRVPYSGEVIIQKNHDTA